MPTKSDGHMNILSYKTGNVLEDGHCSLIATCNSVLVCPFCSVFIQGLYNNAWSRVRVNGQYSEEIGVGVGVHQDSVHSLLLFSLILEALSQEFRSEYCASCCTLTTLL